MNFCAQTPAFVSSGRFLLTVAPLLTLSACGDESPPPVDVAFPEPVELASPAPPGSGEPNLFVDAAGTVYLSFFEREADGAHHLRFSTLDPGGEAEWSAPRTIASGRDFWVNWADFPSLFAFGDGVMAAHWPERSGEGTYDYDVRVAWSTDGGATWGEPVIPHRDGTASEHGFLSFFPMGESELGAVWLDGRDFAGWDESIGGVGEAGRPEHPEMSLRFTSVGPAGLGDEELLDARICDCCQTSAAVTSEGPVIVYRDRSQEEVRDISILRRVDGEWTAPLSVHEDGWVIPACPVNGPMVAAEGRSVVVAWFTAADEVPQVQVAFSSDAGATFGEPIRVDEGDPGGRVAVSLLASGDAIVTWLERIGEGGAILGRKVSVDGGMGEPTAVARSSAARSSGFPRMVRSDNNLVFAWTDPGEGEGARRQVRTAVTRLDGLP